MTNQISLRHLVQPLIDGNANSADLDQTSDQSLTQNIGLLYLGPSMFIGSERPKHADKR